MESYSCNASGRPQSLIFQQANNRNSVHEHKQWPASEQKNRGELKYTEIMTKTTGDDDEWNTGEGGDDDDDDEQVMLMMTEDPGKCSIDEDRQWMWQ